MKQAFQLKYFGMGTSEAKAKELTGSFNKYIRKKEALFQVYDGKRIPYVHNIFDRILAFDTNYLWEDTEEYLIEMFRILKHGGTFILTFTNDLLLGTELQRNEDLFVSPNRERLKKFIIDTGFILNSIENKVDNIENAKGEVVAVNYTTINLSKKEKNRHFES